MTYTLILGVLIAASSAVFSQSNAIYKWTDENGAIHYSERSPKDEKNTNIIQLRKTTYRNTSKSTPGPETHSRQDTQEETAEIKDTVEEVFKKNPELCKQAKANSVSLTNNPIVRKNGRIMTLKQKNQTFNTLKELIKLNC